MSFAEPDWTTDTAPVFMRLRCEYDEIPEDTLRRWKGPYHTLEEELGLIEKQVEDSEGFDINFEEFRDIYNYQPVDFDENIYVMPPETTRELIDRLSRDSLERYNQNKGTRFEFVKVVKANFYETGTAAVMYFITFQGKDLSDDDEPKDFRARVCHFSYSPNKYHSCELKPVKKVHSIETEEKEDAKKRRLAQELSK
uniref:Uncharacterized protein n=2 Tax=Noccaea caerulescens TaxID=107243 RepID=A0A1J3JUY2_NOCCA